MSTTAIKDGQRGTLQYRGHHHHHHHHSPSVNSLEAERADRISRLTGLSGVRGSPAGPPYRNANLPPYPAPTPSTVPAIPPAGAAGLTPAYFDAAGQPVAATKMSTVGSASATESIASTEVGGERFNLGDYRDEDMLTELDSISASGYMGADAMDEDLDNLTSHSLGGFEDHMSDDGNASLVDFGEGAGSTLSGPIYQRRPPTSLQGNTAASAATAYSAPEGGNPAVADGAPWSSNAPPQSGLAAGGRRDFAAHPSERETGSDTPVSQSAVRERCEARMMDGVALDQTAPLFATAPVVGGGGDHDVFLDTTTSGPVPIQPGAAAGAAIRHHPQHPHPPHSQQGFLPSQLPGLPSAARGTAERILGEDNTGEGASVRDDPASRGVPGEQSSD